MTPKEKAKELTDEIYNEIISQYQESEESYNEAKRCSLIFINNQLEFLALQKGFYDEEAVKYFEEVKHEVTKL